MKVEMKRGPAGKKSLAKRGKNGKALEEKLEIPVTFLIVFLGVLCLQVVAGITREKYIGDAWEYAMIGDSLFSSGHFKLSDIDSPIKVWGGGDYRGFVFPVLLGLSQHIDEILGIASGHTWWLVSSMLYSVLFLVYLKFLKDFGIRTNKRFALLRNAFLVILLLVFFYGLIIYPLTDALAAFIAIAAAEMVWVGLKAQGKKRLKFFFFGGVLSYLAYNIRTIYILEIMGLFSTVLFIECGSILRKWKEGYQAGRRKCEECGESLFTLLFMLAGFYIAALPQVYLNFIRYHSFAPNVRVKGLMAQQLWWGIGVVRYGTFIGDDGIHTVQMTFQDGAGVAIQTALESAGYTVSYKSYAVAFFKYPLDFIAILWKHVWNTMFILFPETYVQNLTIDRSIYATLGLLIGVSFLFLFVEDLRSLSGRLLKNADRILLMISLLLPTVAILAGAMEERFLLVFYLMIYGRLSAYQPSSGERYSRKGIVARLMVALLIAFTALSVENGVLSGLQGMSGTIPLLLHGG